MAEKITIAELNINTDALIKSAELTTKAIDKLILKQNKLKKSTGDNRKEFVKNSTELKKQRSIFLQQQKAIIALEKPYTKLSRTLIIARENAKNLGAQFGTNSTQFKAASAEVRKLDANLKRIDKSVGQSQRNVGNYGGAIKNVTARFLGWSVVIFGTLRALGNMFKRVREFDKSMVGLSAILGVNRSELAGLEEEIKNVAGASIKTSNEVADLATTLVTLGKSKTEVIALLKPVNDLAIGLDATSQEAGELLVQTLNAFGKGSDEAGRFADIIAKMRTSTALDFERIKDSLGFLAPVARAVGLSFENTASILGTLVDNGIKASRAGRLMSTAFIQLAKKGISLDEALVMINASEDKLVTSTNLLGGQAGALGLILADNTQKVADLTEEFENSKGTLDDLTSKQLESLDAQLKILDSTWEKFILNVENGNGVISTFFRSIVSGTTDFIQTIDNLNTVSDGFFEFFGNLAKVIRIGGSQTLEIQALGIKLQREQLGLRKELIELEGVTRQAGRGGQIISERELEIRKLNNDELKKQISFFELLNKAEKDKEKADAELQTELSEEGRKEAIKDLETFGKQKIKLQNELNLLLESNDIKRKQKKIEQDTIQQEKEINALKIGDAKKLELLTVLFNNEQIKLDELDDLATTKENKRLIKFEQQKTDLLNEIALKKAETDEEKEALKLQQQLEKQILALENLELTKLEMDELEFLLEEAHLLALDELRTGFREKKEVDDIEANKKEIDRKRKLSKTIISDAVNLVGQQTRLGQALIAIRGALALSETAIELGLLKQKVVVAQAGVGVDQVKGLSKTASVGFPQNIPLIIAFIAQFAGIISALKGVVGDVKNVSVPKFYEGGQIPELGSGRITTAQNIPTQAGGDNVLAKVRRGEVILNKTQQERAGGSAFFRSIGVPSFQTGGTFGIDSTTDSPTTQQGGVDLEALGEVIATKMNDIKIVAIESDITNAQVSQVEITDGARF